MRCLQAGNKMNWKIVDVTILEPGETSGTAINVEDRTGLACFGLGRRNSIDSLLFNCCRLDCTTAADLAFQRVHRD
jgi:hypothetical protein